jgi:Zn-dependent M28 family amino/carboxypeptidase
VRAALALLAVALTTCSGTPSGERARPRVRVDPARLESSVRQLATRNRPRDAAHPKNLAATAAWIGAQLAATGAAIAEQSWTTNGAQYRNVIVRIGPDTPERIVIGAHYDTAGDQPGADDDASGVAALVELGHLLARDPPPLAVELVAYSLEEPPYFATPQMGSVHHADLLADSGVHVRAMLALEMLGYFSDSPGSQRYPNALVGAAYPDRGDFIAVVGNLAQLSLTRRVKAAMLAAGEPVPVESIAAPEAVSGVDLSDHRSYWARGFPAVMITDTAFLRNPNYHDPTDTPDTLDFARMASVVAEVHAAVWALASEP